MLRLTWRATSLRPRLLSEEEFVREFEPLAARDFAGLPSGPVSVEGLDAEHRLSWSGHYKSADGLRALLEQLKAERAFTQQPAAKREK